MSNRDGPDAGHYWQDTLPFTLAIPAQFSVGQVSGQLACINDYTARVTLSPPLTIRPNQELILLQAAVPYTQPNIGPIAAGIPGFTAGNNRISIAWDGGARTDYFVPQGLYSVADLAYALNQIAATAGWIAAAAQMFTLVGVAATQKVTMVVNPAALAGAVFPASGVVIDFLNPSVAAINDSIGPIMGWPTSGAPATLTIAGGGAASVSFDAPNVANFALYSAFALFASCAQSSSVQGVSGQIIASFPLGAAPSNSVVAYQPTLANRVQVAPGTYATLDFWTTDQAGNKLKLVNNQAPFTFSFQIVNKMTTPRDTRPQ